MGDEYSLECLVKTFSEHVIKSEENQKKSIDRFMENNPGEPLPEYMLDAFNLAKALLSICNELLTLKKKGTL